MNKLGSKDLNLGCFGPHRIAYTESLDLGFGHLMHRTSIHTNSPALGIIFIIHRTYYGARSGVHRTPPPTTTPGSNG
jgi:hypothetical protein